MPASPARVAYAVLGFTVYSAAGTMVLRNLNGEAPVLAGESEITSALAQTLLLLGIVPALLPYRHRLVRDVADLRLYFLIVALCLLSAAWSPFPWLTLRRSVTLGICVLFGLWCHLALGLAGTLKLYARTTLVLCVLSVLAYLALPAVGREVAAGYENAMRGVYSHKNTLGESAVLAVTCCFYEMFAGGRRRVCLWLAILFLAGCELLARTGTSLLVTMLVIAAGTAFLLRPRPRLRLVAGMAAGLLVLTVVVAFAADPDTVFDLFGRDASLTGRVPLWIYSFQAAQARPLLGYGYNGFWVDNSIYVAWLWAMLGGWKAPNSHNGYLDIVLQIGLVGLGLYLAIWLRVIRTAWAASRRAALPGAAWVLLFMLSNAILNLDEGPLPYPDAFTVMMPVAMLYLARWRREIPSAGTPNG